MEKRKTGGKLLKFITAIRRKTKRKGRISGKEERSAPPLLETARTMKRRSKKDEEKTDEEKSMKRKTMKGSSTYIACGTRVGVSCVILWAKHIPLNCNLRTCQKDER